jgi:alginate O-acetyltransferase complex protein AlgI
MLFNSIEFLFFFPCVTIFYFLLPHKYRWLLLLLASCYFYMSFIPIYILILALTILVDYFAAIYIEKSTGNRKKMYLVLSIWTTCIILFFFKYYNFFNSIINDLSHLLNLSILNSPLALVLPIGLSFHTFQSLSYVIEVYRGNQKAEKNFGIYSLYVMFYPQLVAGPIERPQNLLYQFYEEHTFDYERVTNGLKLMAWGLFKKIVISDRLAGFVNEVFNNPRDFEGMSLIIACIFFSIQIYCDFSGYSDIAIGSAQVMGFKLMDNFKRPYFSKSVSEFWQRWHISLSTWFKDYLYISLGGNRVSIPRWYLNLFITFLISGLWHGANWTFIVWGALNGLYIIFENITLPIRKKITSFTSLNPSPAILKSLQVITTFSLITFAWIFFRANSMSDAYYIITHLFSNINEQLIKIISGTAQDRKSIVFLNQDKIAFVLAIISILVMEIIHAIQRHTGIRHMLSAKPVLLRWSIYLFLIFSIILFSNNDEYQFIYFQF